MSVKLTVTFDISVDPADLDPIIKQAGRTLEEWKADAPGLVAEDLDRSLGAAGAWEPFVRGPMTVTVTDSADCSAVAQPDEFAQERDRIYAERNQVVFALAQMARDAGWTYGIEQGTETDDWPVLIIDTPAGQVSWHIPAAELPGPMPSHPTGWDGHDTPEKYRRLAALGAGVDIGQQPVGRA